MMPDYAPDEAEDYYPWDCDNYSEDLGNYDDEDDDEE